jgi:hypothetical protein
MAPDRTDRKQYWFVLSFRFLECFRAVLEPVNSFSSILLQRFRQRHDPPASGQYKTVLSDSQVGSDGRFAYKPVKDENHV